jgi:uncharacterized protein
MTTNGYALSIDLATELIRVGVTDYQISLDGPSEYHDRTRLRANGEGSYRQIWENLMNLRNSSLDFNVILRVHLTPENLHSMPQYVELLIESFDDSRFSLFFKEIGHYGGPNDENINVLGFESRAARTELMQLVNRERHQINLMKSAAEEICYAARANAFLIRPNGNIGKCTIAIEEDRNCIGKLTEDGKIEIDLKKLQPWMRGLAALDFNVLGCPATNWPKLSIEANNDHTVNTPQ